MKKMIWLMMAVVLSMGATAINGAIVEYPLDICGTYNPFDTQIAEIDVGVMFTDISDISIDWSGDITAELSTSPFPPPSGNPFPTNGVFSGSLYKTDFVVDTFGQVFLSGGVSTHPEPEPFALQQTFSDYG